MFRSALSQCIRLQAGGTTIFVVQPNRNLATLKDISLRLKSVKNIQKITKSMKMVSAAKFARAERELKPARPYGEGAQAFYKSVELTDSEKKNEHLMVLISSDRGLCGGIHSNIGRAVKADMAEKPADMNVKMFCVGDKARGILSRLYANEMLMSANDVGKTPPTFIDASVVAQHILDSGYEFDHGDIYYNRFKSVVAYNTLKLPIFSLKQVSESGKFAAYDSIDSDVLQSYMEYSLVSLLYYAMKESACSEQSSRMTAMDGASKNAGEMIDKMTILFNRTRQAVITRELIEIISGAAAL